MLPAWVEARFLSLTTPAPEDPHNARLPHVLMDYFFMGQDDSKVFPMIGLKERQCKMKFAHMVEERSKRVRN